MNEDVNGKRRYRSPRRASQAQETRDAVLDASLRLFTVQGWSKTTIAAIARAASVSGETIYATFGSKRAILEVLVTRSIRGAAPDVALLDQEGPQAVRRAPDQARQIATFAADIADILNRVAPLIDVVRAAAETDAEMAELYATLHRGRRKNLTFVADALRARAPLRDGLDRAAATKIIWRLASPELFLLLRRVEGLSLDGYRKWLADALGRLLLKKP